MWCKQKKVRSINHFAGIHEVYVPKKTVNQL